MTTKIRADLIDAGCTDEKLIAEIEKDWLEFNVAKPRSKQSEFECFVKDCHGNLQIVFTHISDRYGLPKHIATVVTRSFGFKSKRQTDIQNSLNLGSKYGVWRYLNAHRTPCNHSCLDGKFFYLKRGIRFKGEFIYPGDKPGCMCGYRVSVPFLEETPPSLLQKIILFFRG